MPESAFIQGSFFSGRGSEADDRSAIDYYCKAVELDHTLPPPMPDWRWPGEAWRPGCWAIRSGRKIACGRAPRSHPRWHRSDLAAAHSARAYLLTYADVDSKGA